MLESDCAYLKIPSSEKSYLIYGSKKDQSVMNTLKENNGFYEPEVMAVMRSYIRESDICIDIGGNIGVTAIAMATYADKGQVYSFEALPQNFSFLRKNLAENSIQNCEPISQGLFSSNCTLEFNYVDEFAGGGFTSPIGATDLRAEKVLVDCVRLDDWVNEKGLSKIDFIKLDVEGSELDVLNGAKEVIDGFKPKLIVEVNPVGAKTFFGQDLLLLYEKIASLYPNVCLISRLETELVPIRSFDQLIHNLDHQGGLGDLVCSY